MMLVKGVSLKVIYKHCDNDPRSSVSPPLLGAEETTLLSLVEPARRARHTTGAALAFRLLCRGS